MPENLQNSPDAIFMGKALDLAQEAFYQNEVPIGAVVVDQNGKILGTGFNLVEKHKSQCAHAEVIAIQKASQEINDWRLDGCAIYVTIEPCSMCYSLMRLSRLEKLVFGAASPRFGYQLDKVATSSVYKKDMRVVSGVCSEQAQQLMKRFFQMQRNKKGEQFQSGSQED